MWASVILGTLLLAASLSITPCSLDEKLLAAHFMHREKAYCLEHEFEAIVRSSINKALEDDEQIIATCTAIEAWAASDNANVSISFDSERISIFDSILDLVAAAGKKNMAGVLKHYTGACAMVIKPGKEGILIQNRGFLEGHGMSRTAFVVERGEVRVMFTEGRQIS